MAIFTTLQYTYIFMTDVTVLIAKHAELSLGVFSDLSYCQFLDCGN
jgi:hypothetical protein